MWDNRELGADERYVAIASPEESAAVDRAAAPTTEADQMLHYVNRIHELERELAILKDRYEGALGSIREHQQLVLQERKARKEAEELHRMQMAGITTASLANTRFQSALPLGKVHPYWTPAYEDVLNAVGREIRERERAERAEAMAQRESARVVEAEAKLQRYEFASEEDEFDDKGVAAWDLSPHYEEAVHQLTKRKAYSKSSCAQMIAEGWKAHADAESSLAIANKLADSATHRVELLESSLAELRRLAEAVVRNPDTLKGYDQTGKALRTFLDREAK